jgi:hypothetical protein
MQKANDDRESRTNSLGICRLDLSPKHCLNKALQYIATWCQLAYSIHRQTPKNSHTLTINPKYRTEQKCDCSSGSATLNTTNSL